MISGTCGDGEHIWSTTSPSLSSQTGIIQTQAPGEMRDGE